MSTTLMKNKRVATVERDSATNELFVDLAPEWQLDGAHCFGAETVKEAQAVLRDHVTPCTCDECTKKFIGWIPEARASI